LDKLSGPVVAKNRTAVIYTLMLANGFYRTQINKKARIYTGFVDYIGL